LCGGVAARLLIAENHMGTIALVTANFGGIDRLKPLPVDPHVDSYCYTDNAGRMSTPKEVSATWHEIIVPDYPRNDFNDRLRSRYFKHQIHRLNQVRGYRWLAWTDSSLLFKNLSFLVDESEKLSRLEPHQRLLLIPHPDRDTVADEYAYIQKQISLGNDYLKSRYYYEKMREQMLYFKEVGWSAEVPLYCGTFWLVENSEIIQRALDDWWDQNIRFGMMDQLSLTPVLYSHSLSPQRLDVRLWDNEYFRYITHGV